MKTAENVLNETIERTMNTVFQITDYNFDQIDEVIEKAKVIMRPLLFPAIKSDTIKYLNCLYLDEEAIEKTCNVLKIACKNNKFLINMDRKIDNVAQQIKLLKIEYKSQKVIF